jgi:hypothetical protein
MYEKQIQQLNDNIQQLSLEAIKRPSTVNNNNNNTHTTNINNLAVFVKSDLEDALISNPINKQIMHQGVPGIAQHVGSIIKAKTPSVYMITDASRLKCKYKDENGNIVTDHKCNAIVSSVSPALSEQASSIHRTVASAYEIRRNIHALENIKIVSMHKCIKTVQQQLDDLPDRRSLNHPDRPRLNQQLEDYNEDLKDLLDQLESFKEQAINSGVRLDVPIEFYEEDYDKTSQHLKDIKNIPTDNKASFAKTLIESII